MVSTHMNIQSVYPGMELPRSDAFLARAPSGPMGDLPVDVLQCVFHLLPHTRCAINPCCQQIWFECSDTPVSGRSPQPGSWRCRGWCCTRRSLLRPGCHPRNCHRAVSQDLLDCGTHRAAQLCDSHSPENKLRRHLPPRGIAPVLGRRSPSWGFPFLACDWSYFGPLCH